MQTRGFALPILLVLATILFAVTPSVGSTKVSYRYVRIPAQLVTPEFVKSTDFIRDHQRDDYYALGYIREEMKRWACPAQPKTRLPYSWMPGNGPRMKWTLRLCCRSFGKRKSLHRDGPGTSTLMNSTTELQTLAASYPKLATLASAGKSVQGKDLWYLRITSGAETGKPKLLYVSSMHGDEVTGKEMMVYLIRELLTHYGGDPRVTSLVDNANIYIMPSMNPDGTALQQRFNANGVDLNRDFPGLDESPFATEGRAPETSPDGAAP